MAHLAYIGEAAPLTNVFQSYATRWQYIRQAFERNWTATSADAVSYLIRLPSLQPEIAEWEHNADELAIERRHQALLVPKEEDEEELWTNSAGFLVRFRRLRPLQVSCEVSI